LIYFSFGGFNLGQINNQSQSSIDVLYAQNGVLVVQQLFTEIMKNLSIDFDNINNATSDDDDPYDMNMTTVEVLTAIIGRLDTQQLAKVYNINWIVDCLMFRYGSTTKDGHRCLSI
jgi:hypothetical protein